MSATAPECTCSIPKPKNQHLNNMKSDYLYHLDILIENTKETSDIQKRFGDVKVVCMGGTTSRVLEFAKHVNTEVYDGQAVQGEYEDISAAGNRYALYKVGEVLCCSHGIGGASMSVVLHELMKLMFYAKCQDPIFLRLGTCGGLAVAPGTVVVTKDAFNGYLKCQYEIGILGKKVVRPAKCNYAVLDCLMLCNDTKDNFRVVSGNTMSTDCFYEGQARLDGASCDYNEDDKKHFLLKCVKNYNIRNIEMEILEFSSLTKHIGFKAGAICVTLLDRFHGDQITIPKEEQVAFESRPHLVAGRFIKRLIKELQQQHPQNLQTELKPSEKTIELPQELQEKEENQPKQEQE